MEKSLETTLVEEIAQCQVRTRALMLSMLELTAYYGRRDARRNLERAQECPAWIVEKVPGERPRRPTRYLSMTEPTVRGAMAVDWLGSRSGKGVGQHIPTEPGLPKQVSSDTRLHVSSGSHWIVASSGRHGLSPLPGVHKNLPLLSVSHSTTAARHSSYPHASSGLS